MIHTATGGNSQQGTLRLQPSLSSACSAWWTPCQMLVVAVWCAWPPSTGCAGYTKAQQDVVVQSHSCSAGAEAQGQAAEGERDSTAEDFAACAAALATCRYRDCTAPACCSRCTTCAEGKGLICSAEAGS